MISETAEPPEAYVWVWLPGAGDPVVAGLLEEASRGGRITFTYASSYRARSDAISLYEPELQLEPGRIAPRHHGIVASCLRDASPDAWGRRVIVSRWPDPTVDDLGELTNMLESGSDRIGGLDFQASATDYVPRDHGQATLADLESAARAFAEGEPLPEALIDALAHGTSIGGARPKALLNDGDRHLIAKFSSSSDRFPMVKGEFVAMTLAHEAGLNVARVELTDAHGRDVLLIERFDRPSDGGRRLIVSALTMLGLDEMDATFASSYAELAAVIRDRFHEPIATLRELFGRITFNILCSNIDDHARNHSSFWDGRLLTLTPAYDVCPQARAGGEIRQAMAIGSDGWRFSQLAGCVERAGEYLPAKTAQTDAREIIDRQIATIRDGWKDACDRARLTRRQRDELWERQFLNPYAFYGY
jgi:serine/threonine-protein kinase HipA